MKESNSVIKISLSNSIACVLALFVQSLRTKKLNSILVSPEYANRTCVYYLTCNLILPVYFKKQRSINNGKSEFSEPRYDKT